MSNWIRNTLMVCSVLGLSLGSTACAVNSDEDGDVGEGEQALTGPTGTGFFGSDTLFDATTAAVADSLVKNIKYLGTGSGNGEACMRGNPVVFGGVTYCNGTPGQTITMMSRHLNPVAGSCVSGEVEHRIALDGIGIWTGASQTATGASSANVKAAFCGTNGAGTAGCITTWSAFTSGSSNPTHSLVMYRRDDVSGTTDTFKTLNSCTAFCPGINIVTDDAVAGPRLSTDAAGTSSISGTGKTCLVSDSATDCIGRLAAANVDVVAYAGLSASLKPSPAPTRLLIDGIDATITNIRFLANGLGTPYPYSRFLYLNENPSLSGRATAETKFLNWALTLAPSSFETDLQSVGFISCDPTTPLACGTPASSCSM